MPWHVAFAAILIGLCLIVVVMDLRYGIISDKANAVLAALGLADAAISGRDVLIAHCFDAGLVGASEASMGPV